MSENIEKPKEIEDPYILQLRKPVKLGDVPYETLTLTEPTAEQMEEASVPHNGVTSNIVLVSKVAKIPEAAVRKIGYRDFSRAVKYLENFIGPQTGEKSSQT